MGQNLTSPEPFFNRTRELELLARAWARSKAGLLLLYGRRRIGKTYLLQRFLSDVNGASGRCYYLADQSTPDLQRLALAERLVEAFPDGLTAPEIAVSWNALLRYFGAQARRRDGKAMLVLDEFPYLVAETPSLPSVIQAWWDEEGAHLPALIVLCGSQLSTMASLDGPTAPLHGRFNAGRLLLEPMSYLDVSGFYDRMEGYGPSERLLMYGALGGTPRYHGEAEPGLPWDEQLVDLLLRPGAPFEGETRMLLAGEQIRDPGPYNAVLTAIARGRTRGSTISDATGLSAPALTHPLNTLQALGWIRRERSFGETGDRRSVYRINDPFLQFWYRFGMPLASALRFEEPMQVFRRRIAPDLDNYMGRDVFEGICTQWLTRYGGPAADLRMVGDVQRYWNRDGSIEIDQAVELEDGRFLFGECKWSRTAKLGPTDFVKLRAKVERLPEDGWRTRARYVLYSLGGFTPDLRAMAEADRDLWLVDAATLFDPKPVLKSLS